VPRLETPEGVLCGCARSCGRSWGYCSQGQNEDAAEHAATKAEAKAERIRELEGWIRDRKRRNVLAQRVGHFQMSSAEFYAED
jgi:hypothetical protein